MAPVNRVTIHHEGAGSPTENVQRFLSTDDYSIGIGITGFVVERSPSDSFVTTGQNGQHSLQVCLSGNRDEHGITNNDIDLVRRAVADARARGWVTDRPDVFFHKDTVGTACPGTNSINRRAELETACRLNGQLRLERVAVVQPMFAPALRLSPIVCERVDPQVGGLWLLGEDGAVYSFGGSRNAGGANGRSWFGNRKAALIEPPFFGEVGHVNGAPVSCVYVIVSRSGERFRMPDDRP